MSKMGFSRVLWRQTIGIGSVQGAISLSWLIYRLYLPKLLLQFGFPEKLAVTVLIIENALGIITEPVFGGLSDFWQTRMTTRLPLISLGVILASAFSVCLPALVIFGNPTGVLRWLLILVIIAWALSMTVFRSPLLAMLGMCAPVDKLPIAMSLLISVAGLIGAFAPVSSKFLLSLGAGVCFTLASLALLGGVATLRFLTPNRNSINPSPSFNFSPVLSPKYIGLIVLMGLSLAWGSRFLMMTVTKTLDNQWASVGVGILLAFAAFPNGFIAAKIGNAKAMLIGLGTSVFVLLLLSFSSRDILLGLGIGLVIITFNLVMNGTIPLIFSFIPPARVGLAIGFYFGGFSGGSSLFDFCFPQPATLTPLLKASLGAIALLLTALCVFFSEKINPKPT